MNTSNHSVRDRVLWKANLLWTCLPIIVYALIVLSVEYKYMERKSEGWKTYTAKNSPLLNDHIRALTTDDKGNVWIGTQSGLYLLSTDGSWTRYTKENTILYNDEILSLAIDRTGRLWVGTYNGLYVLDTSGQWTTYMGRENHRLGIYVKALAVDSLGRVWVGTNRGLSVFDMNGVETIYTEDNSGLERNEVVALAVDRSDRVWIGASSLQVLNREGRWSALRGDSINILSGILALLIDQQDQVWVGTQLGINVVSPDGNWIYPQSRWESMLSSIYVDAFTLDEQDRFWVGTLNELFVVDTYGNWTRYTPINSGLPGWVRVLAIDNNEKLWVGTSKGLSMLDLRTGPPKAIPEDWLSFRAKIRAPVDFIMAVGKVIFFPIGSFFAPCYIPLLLLIIVSPIVAIRSKKSGRMDLYYGSLVALIVSIMVAVAIWCSLAYLYIAIGD